MNFNIFAQCLSYSLAKIGDQWVHCFPACLCIGKVASGLEKAQQLVDLLPPVLNIVYNFRFRLSMSTLSMKSRNLKPRAWTVDPGPLDPDLSRFLTSLGYTPGQQTTKDQALGSKRNGWMRALGPASLRARRFLSAKQSFISAMAASVTF